MFKFSFDIERLGLPLMVVYQKWYTFSRAEGKYEPESATVELEIRVLCFGVFVKFNVMVSDDEWSNLVGDLEDPLGDPDA
jgi:hypothetical protein